MKHFVPAPGENPGRADFEARGGGEALDFDCDRHPDILNLLLLEARLTIFDSVAMEPLSTVSRRFVFASVLRVSINTESPRCDHDKACMILQPELVRRLI